MSAILALSTARPVFVSSTIGKLSSKSASITLFFSCVPSPDHCIDFAKCINPNGYINIVGDADCTEATCTSGYTGSDPETNGFGYEVSCTEPGSTLAANGASTAFIACNCDGKTDCQWESDDLPGPLTEDGVCPSDSDCPGKANQT